MFLPGIIIILLCILAKAIINDSKTNTYIKNTYANTTNNQSQNNDKQKTIQTLICRFCQKEIVYKEEFPSYCPFCGNKIF